ncbi:MAG: hypothetical protein ACI9JN_001622 [Bacteroidia bacterium]|jgi:hypothetical protein
MSHKGNLEMLTDNGDLQAGVLSKYQIEGINGVFNAYSTGVKWNGSECPIFTMEQVKVFINILNKDDDFDAKLINGVVIITIKSSEEDVRIEERNGFYEFAGWLFIAYQDVKT